MFRCILKAVPFRKARHQRTGEGVTSTSGVNSVNSWRGNSLGLDVPALVFFGNQRSIGAQGENYGSKTNVAQLLDDGVKIAIFRPPNTVFRQNQAGFMLIGDKWIRFEKRCVIDGDHRREIHDDAPATSRRNLDGLFKTIGGDLTLHEQNARTTNYVSLVLNE
ncbi:hypothetical protein CAQU_04090 [Corynebacterium aquilae DSM 44791]|uniref:Uncharacterized protein n=1 Tax=Corynebacterium aquilae DSM 44791 TaxID=1431546 RepID=A0A1L7CEX7_9CORY|nr:hypothetical protein CAQU_04090 [Corynebacterium aquilae DSM 44791]